MDNCGCTDPYYPTDKTSKLPVCSASNITQSASYSLNAFVFSHNLNIVYFNRLASNTSINSSVVLAISQVFTVDELRHCIFKSHLVRLPVVLLTE